MNTPLRFWLSLPPVWLASKLGWSKIAVFYGYMFLLAGLSLSLCRYILNLAASSMPVWARQALLLTLVYLFTLYAGDEFGQKEHTMFILAMPYVLAAAGRATGQSLNRWLALGAGGLAGIGLSIKPFFLLVWLTIELYLFAVRRWEYPYRRPENVGLGLVLFGYWAYLALDGAYLALVPLLQQTYGQLHPGRFFVLLNAQIYGTDRLLSGSATQLAIAGFIAMLIIPPPTNQDKTIGRVLLITSAGLLIIAFYQQKGWSYHFYGAGAAALLLLVLLLLRLTAFAQKWISPQRLVLALALLFLLQGGRLLLAKADGILTALTAGRPLAHTLSLDPSIARLIALIKTRTNPDDYIAHLGHDVYPVPLLLNYTRTRYSLRYAHAWLLESAYRDRRDEFFAPRSTELFPYHTPAEMDEIEREFMDNIISDLLAHPPRLVLVNTTWKFDYIKYFSQDARFVQFWANYVFLEQVDYDEPPFANRRSIQVFQYLPSTDYTPAFTQKLRLINPTDSPYVYAYIWNDGQTETYLLDNASYRGREYEVEWVITPQGVSLKGAYQQRQPDLIKKLSDHSFLAVAVSFSDSPTRATQQIFERRFWFNLTKNNLIEIFFPPEEWCNPLWPDQSAWRMENVNQVIQDR